MKIAKLPTLLALWSILLIWAPAFAAGNPHAELADPKKCENCHDGALPASGNVVRPLKFKKDVVSLCLDCHVDKDVTSLHPVDVRPSMRVPADLPLDEEKTVTCGTCHNPHMESEGDTPYVAEALANRLISFLSPTKRYKTYFLRRGNKDGSLCSTCHVGGKAVDLAFHKRESQVDKYVGSSKCGECHPREYKIWRLTSHSRFARDPAKNPESVLGDFKTNPPFRRDDVKVVLGTRWTQRYVVEKEGRMMVKAPIWSIPGKSWDRSYWVDKPWDQFCQGCHTTGFEMIDKPKYSELGVGCEACHGPGKNHVTAGGGKTGIVNPAKLKKELRDMICESCHTAGHDASGQFRFPIGYTPGKDLTKYYKGLMPKPGQDNKTFMGDGSYTDRHRQWEFWVDSYFNAKGLTCDICKNFRERGAKGAESKSARMTVSEHCMTCHDGKWQNAKLHEGHIGKEVQCDKCHIPEVAKGGESYSIHDHKFFFGKPEAKKSVPPKETCANCHDKKVSG